MKEKVGKGSICGEEDALCECGECYRLCVKGGGNQGDVVMSTH